MKEPNKQQLSAIQHAGGPALILAGPGSGKTFTIIQRILFLIYHQNIPPDQIIVVTFSKAAAKEMYQRYQMVIEKNDNGTETHFGTFHSLGFSVLRESCHLQIDALVSENEKRKYMEIVLKNLGYSDLCHYEKITGLLDCFSSIKNNSQKEISLSPYSISDDDFYKIRMEYESFLKEQGKIDFDDMILRCVELFEQKPQVLAQYQNKYQYFLIDEFQDINEPQYKMIQMLAEKSGEIFAVGDDDQSIYGFRGSSPVVMQIFLKDYPDAQCYQLTSNFRSGQGIVRFAEKIISRNKERFPKHFFAEKSGGQVYIYHFSTHKEEEEQLIRHIKEYSSLCLCDTAVILRTNHEAALFRELLRKNDLPVHTFHKLPNVYDSFIMEDILAFLCYLYEGHKRSDFLYFMNKPNHFFQRAALIRETVSADDLLSYYNYNSDMKQQIIKYFHYLELAKKLFPPLAIQLFCHSLGYHQYLRARSRSNEEYQQYQSVVSAIQTLFESYSFHQSLKDYVQKKRKEEGIRSQITLEKGIQVMTMHASKGLEFEHVYLPDVNEGIIPSKKCLTTMDLEEERRLLYVAITRAKTKLFLYETAERNRSVSRFLEGIIPQNPNIHQIPDCPDIRQKHPQLLHIPHHH